MTAQPNTYLDELTEMHRRYHESRKDFEDVRKNAENFIVRWYCWGMIKRLDRVIVELAKEMNRVAIQETIEMHNNGRERVG